LRNFQTATVTATKIEIAPTVAPPIIAAWDPFFGRCGAADEVSLAPPVFPSTVVDGFMVKDLEADEDVAFDALVPCDSGVTDCECDESRAYESKEVGVFAEEILGSVVMDKGRECEELGAKLDGVAVLIVEGDGGGGGDEGGPGAFGPLFLR
jgi:hypothetical protein